jgi:DNA-binding beta-propeller fold protein YncE
MRFLAVLMLMVAVGTASGQVLESKTYGTSGKPTEALATPDGQWVLVTVDAGRGGGIDVFHVEGDRLKKVAFQPLGSEGTQGILLIPHTKVLAVGLSNAGVAFLPLEETLKGKAKPGVLAQGDRSGSGYLAASPDGQLLFVANEYGEGGNLGVIALHTDAAGVIHPVLVTKLHTPISTDGKRVYTVGEVMNPKATERLPGHGVAELQRDGCVQGSPGRGMPNGVLYGFDVAKLEALTVEMAGRAESTARVALVNAGCSPVREAVTADGALVYVTARGDNKVLVFDTKRLESDPEHALVRAIATGGEAPVGLKLFDGDRMLLVANSNRFAGGNGNATVFDVSGEKPVLKQTIKTGEFPRNITASADGKTLYLTIFNGNELMVLRAK